MTVPVSQRGAASDSLALLLQRRVCTFLIKVLLLVTSWISMSLKLCKTKRVASRWIIHSAVSYTSFNASHKITSKMLHHSSRHSTGNSNHKQVETGQQQHVCVNICVSTKHGQQKCHILLAWTPIQWKKNCMHSVDSKYVRKFMKWQEHVWFTIMIQVSLHLLRYTGFTALTPIHTYHCTYSDTHVSLHLFQYIGFIALTLMHRFHSTYSNTQVSLHLLQYTGFTALTPINMFHCAYSHTQVSLHLLPYTGFTALTPVAAWPDDVLFMMIFGTATLLKFFPLNCTPHPPLKWMQKNCRTERKCWDLFSLSLAREKRLEGTVQFHFSLFSVARLNENRPQHLRSVLRLFFLVSFLGGMSWSCF